MLAQEAVQYWLNVLGNDKLWEVIDLETDDYGFRYYLTCKLKGQNVYFSYSGDIREGRALLGFLEADKAIAFQVENAFKGVLSHDLPQTHTSLSPNPRSSILGHPDAKQRHSKVNGLDENEPIPESYLRVFGEELDD